MLMRKIVLLLLLWPTVALAQPTTTQVTQNNETTQCTASQLVYGGGVGSPTACLNLGTNLSITTGTLNGAGGVTGPGTTTAGNIATYADTTGNVLASKTLTAELDAVFGTTQGSIIYRNSSSWVALTPGTSGYVFTTQGASANPIWSSVSGSSGCAVSGGAQYNILINNGSSGCSSNTNASANAGTLTLGASGTLGAVVMGNATSGTITVEPVTGALGSVVATIPANTGVIAELNLAQTWSGAQTFTDSDFLLAGSSSGAMTLKAPAVASTYVMTFPAATDTVDVLGTAQTFTAAKTVTNIYDTQINDGTQTSGTYTLSAASYSHKLTVGGNFTLAISNWPASGILGRIEIQLINGGSSTVTWPTTNWLKGDGTTSTTFSSMGVTLQTAGTNLVIIWTTDGGTTLYGKAG